MTVAMLWVIVQVDWPQLLARWLPNPCQLFRSASTASRVVILLDALPLAHVVASGVASRGALRRYQEYAELTVKARC